MKTCTHCQQDFTCTKEDKRFLAKFTQTIGAESFPIPEPTLCVDCRQKRRLSFRNEHALYRRTCDATQKSIISIHPPESKYTVYSPAAWWKDDWDGLDYGQEFDFNRPFFEQFDEVKSKVPHLSLHLVSNENSEYINMSGYCKNCYLIYAAEYCEDCLYGTEIIKCESCLDTFNCFESKFCYEVLDVKGCYELFYSQDCTNCNQSMFLYNCRSCTNCLFSTNLRNKQYYIFNKPYSPEKYAEVKNTILKKLQAGQIHELKAQFEQLKQKSVHRHLSMTNCEQSVGNFLSNCKNCYHCFDVAYGEDCRYVYTGFEIKDAMDVCHTTEAELSYESMSVGYKSYNILFASGAWSTNNAIYVDCVHSGSNLFGCSNLKNKQYCILNKQYSKDEYEALVPKIIKHMQATGEWGQYFPANISPFSYEDTLANNYWPKSKKVLTYKGAIPPNSILCEVTGEPFKLTDLEQKFYQRMQLPLPSKHPNQRRHERMALRPGRTLSTTQCCDCKTNIKTTFNTEKISDICCEQCYLNKLY